MSNVKSPNELGTLYVIATPIGNLKDITLRAIETLKSVEIIACEDTRRAGTLLRKYDIKGRLESYYGAKERVKAESLARHLEAGKSVGLISDAGMPGISDPGALIVKKALEMGAAVVPVPGPSAVTAALAASGFSEGRFVFEGFLPRKSHERKVRLLEISEEERPMVFYESPRRIKATLEDMYSVLGDREAVVAREMTKRYEEFLRGRLSEIIKRIGDAELPGEMAVVVKGGRRTIDWEKADIPAYIRLVQERMGIDRKSALKIVSQLSGIHKSVLYRDTAAEKK